MERFSYITLLLLSMVLVPGCVTDNANNLIIEYFQAKHIVIKNLNNLSDNDKQIIFEANMLIDRAIIEKELDYAKTAYTKVKDVITRNENKFSETDLIKLRQIDDKIQESNKKVNIFTSFVDFVSSLMS